MPEQFLNNRVTLHCGDCLDILPTLAENSIDSCVTDPPYHLTSIVKRFGGANAAPVRVTNIDASNDLKAALARQARGFMGKQWDGGDIAFRPEVWAEVFRVLKPGGHACVFTIPKHIGLVQVAMLEAGFEFRDVVVWAFGSGFPKSHSVSKHIDRQAGARRETKRINARKYGSNAWKVKYGGQASHWMADAYREGGEVEISGDTSATDAARQWEGWGTALKPAVELIILARKPLSEGNIAANVLKWGTGAINVGACRVGTEDITTHSRGSNGAFPKRPTETTVEESGRTVDQRNGLDTETIRQGRWPANLLHDGSDEVVAAFPEQVSGGTPPSRPRDKTRNCYGSFDGQENPEGIGSTAGNASRFFYTVKADIFDRAGSSHPTVKPLDLIQYLIRLITPRSGTCLDPFAGTGTTAEAAIREGCKAVLIEREAEYQADIRRRMALVMAGPDERTHASVKARGLEESPGPLFDR